MSSPPGYVSNFQEGHDKVILQHDNARPRVARTIKTYLDTLKWEVSSHLPYSADVAYSDYYLFRTMAGDMVHQHRSLEMVSDNYQKYGKK